MPRTADEIKQYILNNLASLKKQDFKKLKLELENKSKTKVKSEINSSSPKESLRVNKLPHFNYPITPNQNPKAKLALLFEKTLQDINNSSDELGLILTNSRFIYHKNCACQESIKIEKSLALRAAKENNKFMIPVINCPQEKN